MALKENSPFIALSSIFVNENVFQPNYKINGFRGASLENLKPLIISFLWGNGFEFLNGCDKEMYFWNETRLNVGSC